MENPHHGTTYDSPHRSPIHYTPIWDPLSIGPVQKSYILRFWVRALLSIKDTYHTTDFVKCSPYACMVIVSVTIRRGECCVTVLSRCGHMSVPHSLLIEMTLTITLLTLCPFV